VAGDGERKARSERKRRLSASVDAELLQAAERAARTGRASNVSAWVNNALRLKVQHDDRLRALAEFIEAYEAEHGVITKEEVDAARARAKQRAVKVVPKRPATARPQRKRREVA
jgi:Arc/MetJ-type ribon-helix-helix transcriptional regulator